MVARITNSTRLIPIRLEDADMPAPLRHLVWISADRSRRGAEDAARQIADTLYGRDLRPGVANPPVYLATRAKPGLTAADTTLLVTLAEDAIESGSRVRRQGGACSPGRWTALLGTARSIRCSLR